MALAVAYFRYGFVSPLSRDSGIYLYSGQQFAAGIPPYVSLFDHKGPLAPMLAGTGVMISELLGSPEVATVRALFMSCGALATAAMYLLGKQISRSAIVGMISALSFLALFVFGRPPISEPEPKTPMLLFEALCLLFAVRKNWTLAGLMGSLAMLIWQPMAIFPLCMVALAALHPSRRRASNGHGVARRPDFRSAAHAAGGAALPVALTSAYFWWTGTMDSFVEGFVTFNLKYLEGQPGSTPGKLEQAVDSVTVGTSTVLIPVYLLTLISLSAFGLGALGWMYAARIHRAGRWALRRISHENASARRLARGLVRGLAHDRMSPMLVTLPFPVAWSCIMFQGYPDFYVFFPFVSVALGIALGSVVSGGTKEAPQSRKAAQKAGRKRGMREEGAAGHRTGLARHAPVCALFGLLAGLTILGCVVNVDVAAGKSWLRPLDQSRLKESIAHQKEAALEVREHAPNSRILSLGVPQLLVLLGERNPTRYGFLVSGIDDLIAAETPGGFRGWLNSLEFRGPRVIALGNTTGSHEAQLMRWLRSNYDRERVGPYTLYVQGSFGEGLAKDSPPRQTP